MKERIRLTFLAMFISITSFAQINPDFQTYYDSFLSDASNRSVSPDLSYNLSMKYVYYNRYEYIGISVVNDANNSADVLIKKYRWDTLTNIEKKITVYHELGHILLHRSHQDHNLSIMNTGSVTETEYLANETQLIDELFKPYGNTTALFKPALGNFNDPISLNTGDLVLLSKGYGYPLTPFLVDINDPHNAVYKLGDYQLWIISNVDLNDSASIVKNGSQIIEVRSKNGGINLIQPDPIYQPSWDEDTNNTVLLSDTYFKYAFDKLNTSFDDTPFKLPGSYKYLSLTGSVRIDANVDKWTGKIIVFFYEKPYVTNYE